MGNSLQDNISFGKGMIPQVDPINLPEGAYLDALNMMRNEVGVLMNECGASAESTSIPLGYVIVGVAGINGDIVICSTNGTNSEIGVLETINGVKVYTVKYNNTLLKFSINDRVEVEFKVEYTGNRVIYIAGNGIVPRRLNLDVLTPLIDFEKVTGLFLNYQLPLVTPTSIASGGSVLTGIYQFGVRLITSSNSTTGFGAISEPLPIGSSTDTANRKTYDGAPQGTVSGNIIQLNCTNIDTSFLYIEPCVITYVGEANVLKINSLGKISISGRTSIPITYSGTGDEGEVISYEEVSISPTQYTSAKYITQKDNTLLLAGLTETVDTFDWQSVANSIVVTYDIENIEVTEPISFSADTGIDSATGGSFNDYKNPIICATKKTYKRDEVYSLTITPISLSGKQLDAFHIPARTLEESDNIARAILPAFTTNDVYPIDFPPLNNGTILAGTPIRYHKMPNNIVAPFIGFDYSTGNKSINILSLKINITATGWEDRVSGYIISRESRVGKETIVAQGIVKDLALLKWANGAYTNKWTLPPLLGDTVVVGTDQTNLTAAGEYIDPRGDFSYAVKKDINFYYSPDIITAGNVLDTAPTKIRRVMTMSNTYQWLTPANEYLSDSAPIQGFISPLFGVGRQDIVDISSNGIVNVPKFSSSTTDNPREGGNTVIVNPFGINIYAKRSLPCLLIKTATDLPNSRSLDGSKFHWWNDDSSDDDIQWQPNNVTRNIDLYELVIDSANYYGDVYNKEVIPIKTVLKNNEVLDKTPTCYGGDIFISKYAITIKDTLPMEGSVKDNQTVPKSDLCVYLYVESTNNYNYRHQVEGTTTYFPKEPNLGGIVLGVPVSSGYNEQYNKQYSAQNTIQKSYTKNIDSFVTNVFDNRIVYSETVIEGEQADAFTVFLSANYHDIPKQYGSITGMFTQGNDLYVHTQRSLWRTFYNSLVTQVTSVGEVVLGNGEAFSRPSVPVVALEGGYAGCKDISASVSTPQGRYFYDYNRAKLYLLGDGLQEISNPAIFDLLRSKESDLKIVLGYDYGRKRLLMAGTRLTISFKPELQSFDSRHSYKFSHFISNKLQDYMIYGNQIYKFDDGLVGRYFGGATYPSTLKTASVVSPLLSKRYTSADVVLTSTEAASKLNSPWAFFKNLKMYSRERNTGICTFTVNPDFGKIETFGEILVSKINNKFRFGFAPDIVNDINVDIQTVTNLKSHSSFTDEERLFLPDMTDNHMIFEFEIDNSLQKQLKIQSINVNFDQNIT